MFVHLCSSVWNCILFFFCFKQKTAYEMRISDWSSDVCSSDLAADEEHLEGVHLAGQLADRDRHGREGGEGADHPDDGLERTGGGLHAGRVRKRRDRSEGGGTMPCGPAGGQRIAAAGLARSEERRVGKECVSTCRSRWSPSHYKKKTIYTTKTTPKHRIP